MTGTYENPQTSTTVHSARRLGLRIGGVLVAAAVLLWAGSWWRASMASAQVRSLAVLPFSDLTQQHEAWFAASFTGEIVDSLAHVQGLDVIGRTSTFRSTGDAGKQFGVTAVLQGSIAQTGDRLHVSLTMTRVSDGYQLWSASFDPKAGDLYGAIQVITAAIGHRLRVPLPAAVHHAPTEEAYAAYLQGRALFDQGTATALTHAEEELHLATAADPNFVPAWAWLSIVREYRVAAGMGRPNRLMPGSRDAAERAVTLDPDSPDAHLALGIVKLQYDWDWAGAKDELDRAVTAMPTSAFAHQWRARWSQSQGLIDEAIAETARALALDPLSASLASDAAAEYVALHQPDRAIPFAQKAVALNPGEPAARATLANVLWLAGQKDQAQRIVDELRSTGAATQLPPSVLASLDARLGEPTAARQLLDAAEDLPDEELLPAVEYAGLAAALEDWDRLFSWTEEAYGQRDVELPYWPGSALVPKDDPRFDAFLAQMNLPAPESR